MKESSDESGKSCAHRRIAHTRGDSGVCVRRAHRRAYENESAELGRARPSRLTKSVELIAETGTSVRNSTRSPADAACDYNTAHYAV